MSDCRVGDLCGSTTTCHTFLINIILHPRMLFVFFIGKEMIRMRTSGWDFTPQSSQRGQQRPKHKDYCAFIFQLFPLAITLPTYDYRQWVLYCYSPWEIKQTDIHIPSQEKCHTACVCCVYSVFLFCRMQYLLVFKQWVGFSWVYVWMWTLWLGKLRSACQTCLVAIETALIMRSIIHAHNTTRHDQQTQRQASLKRPEEFLFHIVNRPDWINMLRPNIIILAVWKTVITPWMFCKRPKWVSVSSNCKMSMQHNLCLKKTRPAQEPEAYLYNRMSKLRNKLS